MIPLDPYAKRPQDRGKKPRDVGWPERYYTKGALLLWALNGGLHNLGVRLSAKDLVIDIDPRNGGNKSYKNILTAIDIDFSDYPQVKTGGGGLHIYGRLPDNSPVPYKIDGYPGIEWKTGPGQQVVAPGSRHPETDRPYLWGNAPKDVPEMPAALLKWLAEHAPSAMPVDPTDEQEITPEELGTILAKLPVEAYRTNDAWFKLLAASYHATGGAGVDEFVLWSTSDPEYAEHESLIRQRWKSLKRPGHGKRSLGTLIRELRIHGAEPPKHIAGAQLEDYIATVFDALGMAEKLSAKSSAVEIKQVLRSIKALDPLDQADVLVQIHETTGKPKTILKQVLKSMHCEKKDIDVPEEVAKVVLEAEFESGEHLVFALDGRYWTYSGTYWEPLSTDVLKGLIKKYAEGFRKSHPGVRFQLSSTIVAAEVIIRAAAASGADLMGVTQDPVPVVNCSNCELWLNGKISKRKHSPKSLLTYCLPITYDPRAKCELFDDTLGGIFSPLADSKDVIRHLWEVMGYTIQPKKWIPAWFLFQGRGANGKSLILDVLIKLLGPAARPVASISELSASRNQFAISECVGALAIIDDDVKRDTVLNDDILKKLSEDKAIRAQFKYGKSFTFRNCSTTFLAANSWPQTRDLSDGMMRRAYGFPFRRQFDQDDVRKQHILDHEMAGVLNSALAGLQRLQKRGEFDVPVSCKDLIDEWATKSNQLLGYLNECHDGGRWQGVKSFNMLWEGYEHWSTQNRIQRAYSRPGFREGLLSCGIKETKKGMKGRQKQCG